MFEASLELVRQRTNPSEDGDVGIWMFSCYLVRNAAIGVMRVARRAGSHVAIKVAAASTSGADENAIGSSDPT